MPRIILADPELYADVEPIHSTGSPDDVLGIAYSEPYEQALSIYRALLNSLELSERALALVTMLNLASPSHPTPWWYRQQIITALGYSLDVELSHCFQCLKGGPKPYQVWCHRIWLLSRETDPPNEGEFFLWVISQDICNFHAWTYFGWYAERFRLWTWFFDMTISICRLYPRNNSVWSARLRAIQKARLPVDDEINFALETLEQAPDNQSICGHLKGLVLLDPAEETVAKVRGRIAALIAADPVKQLYILDAELARATGKLDEYAAALGKLAEIDPVRANAYRALQAGSPLYQ